MGSKRKEMNKGNTTNHFAVHPGMEILEAYAKGDLTLIEKRTIEKHIDTCAMCSDSIEGLLINDDEQFETGIEKINEMLKTVPAIVSMVPEEKANKFTSTYKIAAAITILIGFSVTTYFILQNNIDKNAASQLTDNLQNLTSRKSEPAKVPVKKEKEQESAASPNFQTPLPDRVKERKSNPAVKNKNEVLSVASQDLDKDAALLSEETIVKSSDPESSLTDNSNAASENVSQEADDINQSLAVNAQSVMGGNMSEEYKKSETNGEYSPAKSEDKKSLSMAPAAATNRNEEREESNAKSVSTKSKKIIGLNYTSNNEISTDSKDETLVTIFETAQNPERYKAAWLLANKYLTKDKLNAKKYLDFLIKEENPYKKRAKKLLKKEF